MIRSLLRSQIHPMLGATSSPGEYTYGLYRRERVLAVAESAEGQAAKWEGMRRCVATRPIRGGRRGSAI